MLAHRILASWLAVATTGIVLATAAPAGAGATSGGAGCTGTSASGYCYGTVSGFRTSTDASAQMEFDTWGSSSQSNPTAWAFYASINKTAFTCYAPSTSPIGAFAGQVAAARGYFFVSWVNGACNYVSLGNGSPYVAGGL